MTAGTVGLQIEFIDPDRFRQLTESVEFQLLLLYLPGYVAARSATRVGGIREQDDDLARFLWTLTTGLVLVFPLLGLYVLVPDSIVTLAVDGIRGLLNDESTRFVVLYVVVILLSYLIGAGIGRVYVQYRYLRFGTRPTSVSPWSKLANRMQRPLVKVTTSDQREIWGRVRYAGEGEPNDSSTQQDLVLQYPRTLVETGGNFEYMGEYLYLSQGEIARIEYHSGSLADEGRSSSRALFEAAIVHPLRAAGAGLYGWGERIASFDGSDIVERFERWSNGEDEPVIKQTGQELVTEETKDGTRQRLCLTYRNYSCVPVGSHRVQVAFVDLRGAHLCTVTRLRRDIGGYDNWSFSVPCTGPESRRAANYEVRPTANPPVVFPREPCLEGVYQKSVRGSIRNDTTEELVFSEVEVKFFDREGDLLAVEYGHIVKLPPNERAKFNVKYRGSDPRAVYSFDYSVWLMD